MSEAKYNAFERETVITTCDADLYTIHIETYQKFFINRILKLHSQRPEEVNIIYQDDDKIEATIPRKFMRFQAPPILSEEQKAAAKAHLQKINNKIRSSEVDEDIKKEIDGGSRISQAGQKIQDPETNIYTDL